MLIIQGPPPELPFFYLTFSQIILLYGWLEVRSSNKIMVDYLNYLLYLKIHQLSDFMDGWRSDPHIKSWLIISISSFL